MSGLGARWKAVAPAWTPHLYAEPLELERGEGRHVWDTDGRRYLDFFGGILTTITGHAVPEVVEAIQEQAAKLVHTSTLYLSRPLVELAERIAGLSTLPDAKVFFTTSGTEANEAALLVATSYRRSNQILALRNSYHGRSFGTVAITGNRSWSPTSLSGLAVSYLSSPQRLRSPFGALDDAAFTQAHVQELRDVLATTTSGDVACLIAEPVQGVGGFVVPPDGYFGALKAVLDEAGILFIADEVQTGWGRTGDHFWGYQAHGIVPDLLTFAKGVGNGLALGGVVARADVMDSLGASSISTFGGNPLACAGALANLEYLLDHDLQGNALKVGHQFFDRLRAMADRHPFVVDVRGRGLMVAVELGHPGTAGTAIGSTAGAYGPAPWPEAAAELLEATRRRGLLIGKGGLFGNVLRISPPLSITETEAAEGLDILEAAVDEVSGNSLKGQHEMAMLIKNGTVISTTGALAMDVLIDGERVVGLFEPGRATVGDNDQQIDVGGKYVIPGGVDVHTHMELPFGGTNASDTFETGTRAAAHGGTTTIIDFPVQRTGEQVEAGLAEWHRKADGNCAIDYGFHMIIGGVDDQSLKAMEYLVDHEGITSFKLFMAYPGVFYSNDGQILRAMQTASNKGAMIMMHAENGIAIDVLIAQALARGETDPVYHGITRPWETEEEATHRAIMLAQVAKSPVYIVHMSAKQAVDTVAIARDKGWNVFGETCPQYLYLSLEEHLGAPGFEGAKYVCSTPLRARAEGHQDELWKYLRTNDLSVVSTDHCPFCFKEQKELGLGDFSKIPNGIGGVEHRMDLIYQGVVDGHISLPRWVELCATTPARMFGLYPRKGVVAPGSDADLVIYDPNATTRISVETHHMNMDHSAYEGHVVPGRVHTVLSRGTVVIDDGQYVGTKGHGQYLKRGLSQFLI